MSAGEAKHELVGKVLGGRYRVTSMIGRGGMGVVARAVDELLNREVAVKVLRAFTDADGPELADLRSRMRREAQAAARVRHSGVVTVHDVTEERGLPVIVMELVDGPSLDDVLAERGTLGPREAAAIGAKLMDALDAAHRVGVIHRDVKPGNVLLERGGRVVLTDFGIATMDRAGDEALAKLTRSGAIVGSLDYLPPERAQGQEPGPASDIWSLGMTLYAAVEGTSPFRRTSVWSTLSAIVTEPLPEPRRAGPLTPVLRALMAKEPQGRPTADQARAMLEQVAAGSGHGGVAPAPSTPTAPSVAAPAPPPASFGPPPPAAGPGAAPFHQSQPFHQAHASQSPQARRQPPYVGYPPLTGPAGAARQHTAAVDGLRRRSRTVVVVAAAVVVLAAGGLTYALTGSSGGKNAAAAQGAQAAAGSPAGKGQPHTGKASGGAKASGAPSSRSSGKPAGGPSPRPGGTGAHGATPQASTGASAAPGPVPTGCGGWSHKNPAPGSYGYMAGDYHLETGPYQTCPAVTLAKSGTKLSYHCYVVNAYGNKWTYVRVDGTKTEGWMSNDNLTRQKGPSTPC
ncbi:serine/threonine protein phosphatase [Streptomyces sp. CB00455]|uniref:serine/threonine-protein kinase n=1 Tax=Streptomyces sp. CB00455 TaxID=1703927 RepID=UPI00093E689E|nr:serine/threonine-protein kinase [Streptomyces sp. CB00455]OKK17184.1 serine/threonine protein phosphatase [Streptomyces sp. CB00455]